MSKATKKTNEINRAKIDAFRAMITEAAESGNRRMLKQDNLTEHGGTAEWWNEYDSAMNDLEAWSRKMCEYMFNEVGGENFDVAIVEQDKFLSECNDALIAIEKRIFFLLRTEETKAFWHVTDYDGAYIASMADDFQNKRNVERGETINKVHAPATHATFRKRFETHLGTKVLQESVMSGDRAEFLRQERKLMSQISRAKAEREELEERLSPLAADLADPKFDGAQKYIQRMIDRIKVDIAECDKREKGAQDKLNRLRKEHPDGTAHEQSLAEIAEQARTVKGKQEKESKEKELRILRAMKVSKMTKDQMIRELTLAEGEFDETGLTKPELKELIKDSRALVAKEEPEQEAKAATA